MRIFSGDMTQLPELTAARYHGVRLRGEAVLCLSVERLETSALVLVPFFTNGEVEVTASGDNCLSFDLVTDVRVSLRDLLMDRGTFTPTFMMLAVLAQSLASTLEVEVKRSSPRKQLRVQMWSKDFISSAYFPYTDELEQLVETIHLPALHGARGH